MHFRLNHRLLFDIFRQTHRQITNKKTNWWFILIVGLLSESDEKRFRFANDLELKNENWKYKFWFNLAAECHDNKLGWCERKIDSSTNYKEEDQLAIILIMVLLSKWGEKRFRFANDEFVAIASEKRRSCQCSRSFWDWWFWTK